MAALGAAFNDTASLEGTGLQETSLSLSDAALDANGQSPESDRDALIAALAAADAARPDRRRSVHELSGQAPELPPGDRESLVASGDGGATMGGPDTCRRAQADETRPMTSMIL